jgi:hypothetical protein
MPLPDSGLERAEKKNQKNFFFSFRSFRQPQPLPSAALSPDVR